MMSRICTSCRENYGKPAAQLGGLSVCSATKLYRDGFVHAAPFTLRAWCVGDPLQRVLQKCSAAAIENKAATVLYPKT
jgi:hypothetical protein